MRIEVGLSIVAAMSERAKGGPDDCRVDWGKSYRREIAAERGVNLDQLDAAFKMLGG